MGKLKKKIFQKWGGNVNDTYAEVEANPIESIVYGESATQLTSIRINDKVYGVTQVSVSPAGKTAETITINGTTYSLVNLNTITRVNYTSTSADVISTLENAVKQGKIKYEDNVYYLVLNHTFSNNSNEYQFACTSMALNHGSASVNFFYVNINAAKTQATFGAILSASLGNIT